MKTSLIFIGADISKESIDFIEKKNQDAFHFKCTNHLKSLKKYFKVTIKKYPDAIIYLAMENTGRYNWPLYLAIKDQDIKVFVIPALHLKRSMGLTRGKNDKIDATRIADYLELHYNKLDQWKAPREVITQITLLLSNRSSTMNMIRQLKCQLNEMEYLKKNAGLKITTQSYKGLIGKLEQTIKQIEKSIQNIVNQDDLLKEAYKLITSVPGVGKVLAWYTLVKTNEFRYIQDPRKLASYAGVVPYEFSSGTSIKKKNRVSFYADKKLKSLLHMGAMRAVQLEGDLKSYYNRKVEEGKNKMSVLNAVRNKLIHRIYAVMKNKRVYQKNYKNHLVLS